MELPAIKIWNKSETSLPLLYVLGKQASFPGQVEIFNKANTLYLNQLKEKDVDMVTLPGKHSINMVQFIDLKEEDPFRQNENLRKSGYKAFRQLKKLKLSECVIQTEINESQLIHWLEGLLLSQYEFNKYLTTKEEKYSLHNLHFDNPDTLPSRIIEIVNLVKSVNTARDLVNEPGSELTAVELSRRIEKLGNESGFEVETLDKKQITSLKMGGLLAVNKGSELPPTCSVMTYKPQNAVNKKPIILVGKGVVFDTGGLSLKPTANSMDLMKSDMSGAAAVAGVFQAISNTSLPVYVVGIVPATDNRPGKSAYMPGDVVTMFDGTTVEVLNTDAEGRMILADALAYATKFDPELVIDLATLTGTAANAIGEFASVAFFKTDKTVKDNLISSANRTFERLVEFPLWDDYKEWIKSKIADVKNIGGKQGGAITAAKFLEKFTHYPWVHIDIAGTAFNQKSKPYLTEGATAVGVRLLYDFLKNYCYDTK